ncbi:hypothetical protein, partial [Ellagibacter isourolithinifaciens]|uniref:hypothetical protein n=1 Tax=Ellagibacter isourolithinifaciens TaxID=2137581 RepID=UPI003AAD3BC9
HERAPFHACGVAATGSNQTLAIVGLIHGNCMQQGLSMFLCPAHIVFLALSEAKRVTGQDAHPLVRPCIPIALLSCWRVENQSVELLGT